MFDSCPDGYVCKVCNHFDDLYRPRSCMLHCSWEVWPILGRGGEGGGILVIRKTYVKAQDCGNQSVCCLSSHQIAKKQPVCSLSSCKRESSTGVCILLLNEMDCAGFSSARKGWTSPSSKGSIKSATRHFTVCATSSCSHPSSCILPTGASVMGSTTLLIVDN